MLKIDGKPNIKANVVANYAGHIYTMLIGVVMLPFYLQYLGAEPYGLVGFYTVVQSWLQILNMGLSPTFGREMAASRGKKDGAYDIRGLLRSLEFLFLPLAGATIVFFWTANQWISVNWLVAKRLSTSDIALCVGLMGTIVGLHWMTSLYNSGIKGSERQVWENIFRIAMASLRAIGGLILVSQISNDIRHYFLYQLALAAIELAVLHRKLYSLLPEPLKSFYGFDWGAMRRILPFALSVGYLAALWVLLTKLDKLILSKLIPLAEFGYFTIAVVVSGTILALNGPITQALLPRMVMLFSSGKNDQMLALYRKATQFTVVVVFSVTCIFAVFSQELIHAWTGNTAAAESGKYVLAFYALGNGILAVGGFQYILQFAHGKLKLHVYFTTISAAISLPAIILMTMHYGAPGAAFAWFALRLISFFIWTPIIHHIFAPGLHLKWLFQDIGPGLVATLACAFLLSHLDLWQHDLSRPSMFLTLIGLGLIVLCINVLTAREVREYLFKMLRSAHARIFRAGRRSLQHCSRKTTT
jgi:O-antigen/teichoic acid export membrane protein